MRKPQDILYLNCFKAIECYKIFCVSNISSYLKFFLYMRKDAGIPITKGVGANNNCSAQLMHVGNNGMTGNIYSSG